jgi:hypothetical protein
MAIVVIVGVLGVLVLPHFIGAMAGMSLIIALAGGAALAYARYSTAPRTWAEILDMHLARHTPLSREAFLELQGQLKEAGYLDAAIVRTWLDAETERYLGAANRVYGAPATQFLQKRL